MKTPPPPSDASIALLLSGGLDSTILLFWLLARGMEVYPLYVRCGMIWEPAELRAMARILGHCADRQLKPATCLEAPLGDVLAEHWSFQGTGVPDAGSEDQAVFLPGRNITLITKATLWCQARGVPTLALATLGSSPFGDARPDFVQRLQQLLSDGRRGQVAIRLPFAELNENQVMRLGLQSPLPWTFSCLSPRGNLHCGRCNKCQERRVAFAQVPLPDSTRYADAG